ncbi:MAG TPA: beta-ketoacyl synthase chain length factor [Pararobbsia sp.]|nr:beta-ketoacyl synthase chain length factor [Pararobbsia sp.]
MSDLRWTMPVVAWSSTTTPAPKLDFIEPMVRRRLSTLSKMALSVAHDCAHTHPEVRLVFASRHGELHRTTQILRDIEAREPVSPNAFSLSVLNAMSGIYGIARHDRSPATAVAAGAETLGYALLEAHALFVENPSLPVLVVYADEPADAVYGNVEHEVTQGALAVLLDTQPGAQGQLTCSVTDSGAPCDAAFSTPSEALARCLASGRPSAWRGAGPTWQWAWQGPVRARGIEHGIEQAHADRGQHDLTV